MQQSRSNFVTIPGLVILFVLALAAAYAGIGLLFAAITALFLLCLMSRLWAEGSLKKLDFGMDGKDICGFPGDELSLPVRISNDKLLPVVWLSADLGIGEDECVAPKDGSEAVFSWIMPRQKLSWDEPLKALRRGVLRIPSADLVSGDGFGLAWTASTVKLSEDMEIYVFPSILPVDITVLTRRLSEMEAYSKGRYTDPTLVQNTIPYSPGESVRDISWRLLAKQGELLVNKKEKLDTRRMCLVPDFESFSYETTTETGSGAAAVFHVHKEAFEHMLSLAASVIDKTSSSGIRCSLVLPGCGKRGAEIIVPEEAELQAESLLRALAEVEYEGGECVLPCARMMDEYHKLGQFFCLTASPKESMERLAGLESPVWYISSGEAADHVIPEEDILR